MTKRRTLQQQLKRLILPTSLLLLLGAFSTTSAEPGLVPLTSNVMAKLVEKTVQSKLIPYRIEGDLGVALTLTSLDSFNMDWERGECYAIVSFEVQYINDIVPVGIRQLGRARITGNGLFSAGEQKIGIKLLRIDDLKFKGVLRMASDPIRQLLNKKLTGKTFWMGEAPIQSKLLTRSNWTELLKIAVAKNLPMSETNGKSTVNITNIDSLETLTDPGSFRAKLTADGCYKGLFKIPYQGQAVVIAMVRVNPQALSGTIRVDEIPNVTLSHLPFFVGGMVKRSINHKLRGTEFPFSWK